MKDNTEFKYIKKWTCLCVVKSLSNRASNKYKYNDATLVRGLPTVSEKSNRVQKLIL